jgi:4-carboxymuconolactone decarboxylase
MTERRADNRPDTSNGRDAHSGGDATMGQDRHPGPSDAARAGAPSAVGSALTFARESLVDVSASLATRDEAALTRALRIAAMVAPPEAVDEILLQAHLFVGFPVALEAFILWRELLPPTSAPRDSEENPVSWDSRGEEVCRVVYGVNYGKLRANVAGLHPELDRWMVAGGYGRVIGRPGLDLVTRELCIAALLAVWGSPRQLHSHLRGAMHAGASPDELRAAIRITCRHLDLDAIERILPLLDRVLESRENRGASE